MMTSVLVGIVAVACSQTAAATLPAKAKGTPTVVAPTPTPGVVLLDISGNGSHQSNRFTAPGTWDLDWEAQADPNTTGSFIDINFYDAEGNPIAESVNADLGTGTKSDVVHMHYAGILYLDIQGVCSWHIKAVTT